MGTSRGTTGGRIVAAVAKLAASRWAFTPATDRVLRYDAQARKFDDVTARVASGELAVQLKYSHAQVNACPEAVRRAP